MRVEAYLVSPYDGQYRFSFEVHNGRIGEFRESVRAYDYMWNAEMRVRPTLHELVSDYPKAILLRAKLEKHIREAFIRIMPTFQYRTKRIELPYSTLDLNARTYIEFAKA